MSWLKINLKSNEGGVKGESDVQRLVYRTLDTCTFRTQKLNKTMVLCQSANAQNKEKI